MKKFKIGDFRAINGLLLCRQSDVNAVDQRGRTPLFLASLKGHSQAVEALLANPYIDINKGATHHGGTAFSIASEKGHFEIMRLLLQEDVIDVGLGWYSDDWPAHILTIQSTDSWINSTTNDTMGHMLGK